MLIETLQKFSIPEKKNVIFVNPELSKWPTLLAGNKPIIKGIQNALEFRSELLNIARNYTFNIIDSCPNSVSENIIATGHQAVWHHCGIWIKDLSTHKFAKAVDGGSIHLVLDHDICDTAMVLPKQDLDGNWFFKRNEIELSQKNIPLEFRKLPPRRCIESFIDTVIGTSDGQFCNDVWPVEKNNISSFNNIADLLTHFQAVLNAALGLNMMYLPVSKLSESDAFINFVISIMQEAGNFTSIYNDMITKQVNKSKISRRKTVQYLKLDKKTGMIELPFWLFSPNGERTSLYIKFIKKDVFVIGTTTIELGNLDSTCLSGKVEQLKNMLHQLKYRLRPKAVSLTLFARLFLTDWFVHGIGGNLYESVTNHMIKSCYGIEPPSYGVATCTMILPVPDNLNFISRNISQLKHELHSIRHNPEKHIDKSMHKQEPIASLLQVKRETIARAKDRSLPKNVRKTAWNSLLEINESLSEYTIQAAESLKKEIGELEKNAVSHKVCNSREYFFGLFPESKLRRLIESFTFADKHNKALETAIYNFDD